MKSDTQKNGHGDEVFVLVELYYPKRNHLENVMEIAKRSAKLVQGTAGLIQSQVLRPKGEKGPIGNITIWHSQAEFQTFMQSELVKALLKSDDYSNVKAWSDEIKVMQFTHETGWHGEI